jgi:hypothetical protein
LGKIKTFKVFGEPAEILIPGERDLLPRLMLR